MVSGLFKNVSLKNEYSKTCLKRPFKNRQSRDLSDKW